jgi:hypothetical protein
MAIFGRIKTVFNRVAAAYAKAYDALEPSRDMPLEQALEELFHDAEVVHLGDTDHRSSKPFDWLSDPGNLARLRTMGVETIFIERSREFQRCVDFLADGSMTPENYAELTLNAGCRMNFGDSREGYTRQGRFVANAAAAGIHVVFADLGLGTKEFGALEEYCVKAGLGENFIFQTSKREIKKRLKGKSEETKQEYCRLRDIALAARCSDKPTVEAMIAAKKGKAIVVYGSGHEFTQHFTEAGVKTCKIAIYAGLMDYGRALRSNAKEALGDGVYLLDRGMVCLWEKPANPTATPPAAAPKDGPKDSPSPQP